jgi:hypothetical protein
MEAPRSRYDLAYGCYLAWGSSVLAVAWIRASHSDEAWVRGAGAVLLLLLPLLLASFIAMLAGVVLSLRLRRHRPLAVLGAASALLIPTLFTDFGSTALHVTIDTVYGLGVAATCGWWFLAGRRQDPSDAPPEPRRDR